MTFRPTVLTAVVAAGALALAAIYRLDPTATGLILCPYRLLTGWACPGCGLTRATHYLLHADVAAAFAYNPLAFAALPLVLGFVLAPQLTDEATATQWRTRLGWLALALTLSFWLWRNTAAYPFLRL